jgi:uncharacterized protein with PQ loop repeat
MIKEFAEVSLTLNTKSIRQVRILFFIMIYCSLLSWLIE